MPGWSRRASSRSSTSRGSRTSQYINPTFKNLWWDPTNEYQVPKDYGTTGILYRSQAVPRSPTSWKEFYDSSRARHSGKTVFVDSMGDVFVFPLKMLGYSLNSVDQKELEAAAHDPARRRARTSCALDSDNYGHKMADGEAALTLGWTGPLRQEPKDTPGHRATSSRAKARSSGSTPG